MGFLFQKLPDFSDNFNNEFYCIFFKICEKFFDFPEKIEWKFSSYNYVKNSVKV